MTTIIATNISAAPLQLDNLIVPDRILPISTPVTLTSFNKVYEIQADPQLYAYVSNNLCVINDGIRYLTTEEALNLIRPVISTADIQVFNNAPEKEDVHGDDLFLIECFRDNIRAKYKVRASNVILVGSGTIVYTPQQVTETGDTFTKSTIPTVLQGMEIQPGDGHYAIWFSGQFFRVKGEETIHVVLCVDDVPQSLTQRSTSTDAYLGFQYLVSNLIAEQNISIKWWTERGHLVRAKTRSLLVHRYVQV